MDHQTPLRGFLEIPYDRLEEMNLAAKQERLARVPVGHVREERVKYLTDEKRIKAVTVCFTDPEGRFHMLDYEKKFLLKAEDNLTFDGSSIRGFSQQAESDLRLVLDWPAFYWLPADIFGPGKVLAFGVVRERDGSQYGADIRSRLKEFADGMFANDGTIAHASLVDLSVPPITLRAPPRRKLNNPLTRCNTDASVRIGSFLRRDFIA